MKNSASTMVINVLMTVEAFYVWILTIVQMANTSVINELPAVVILRDPTHVIANLAM